jgi:hypothetical protein
MILALLLDTPPSDILQNPAVNFFTTNGIAILAIIVSIIVAVWSIRKQRTKKEISYQVVSDAPVISIKKDVASRVEIKLDGNLVKEVTLAVIKVSNTGNTAIKKDDHDEPLQLIFKGRKVIGSEVVETKPEDLIDLATYKTFLPQSAQTQDYLEFPKFLLNPKQSISFSVLLDGAKDEVSKKGRIVDGKIAKIDLEKDRRPYILATGALGYMIGVAAIIAGVVAIIETLKGVTGSETGVLVSGIIVGTVMVAGLSVLLVVAKSLLRRPFK